MKGKSYLALQVLLWLVCAFHVGIGAGLNLFPGLPEVMAGWYGATVKNWSPELVYMLKPLGAFMFALGFMAACAAVAPLKCRPIVYGFAVLFVCRALQRFAFAEEILGTFGISAPRNVGNGVFFLVLAGLLILCDRLATKALNEPGGASA